MHSTIRTVISPGPADTNHQHFHTISLQSKQRRLTGLLRWNSRNSLIRRSSWRFSSALMLSLSHLGSSSSSHSRDSTLVICSNHTHSRIDRASAPETAAHELLVTYVHPEGKSKTASREALGSGGDRFRQGGSWSLYQFPPRTGAENCRGS